ncbi:MAG: hypothetical protein QOH56_4356 [Pseudonocardiales bacterium]|jgi:hypothetical protein|nr:hypothetical protein [Pseudonocardiales bacterium]
MALAITSYTPTTGSALGGTSCVITGTGLDLVQDVLVGSKLAIIVGTPTATSLTFKTPPGVAGTSPVRVVDSLSAIAVAGTPFTYTAVTVPETLVSSLARKWKLDVDSSVAQDGTGYIPVRAVMDFQPAVADTMVDDSDYDSNGWGSDVKTMLKWSNVVKLGRKKGLTTGGYDPGQEVLRAAQDQFGAAAVVRIRWYDRNKGPEAYEGFAQVQWNEDGGSTSALGGVTCTLTGNGQRTLITNPMP